MILICVRILLSCKLSEFEVKLRCVSSTMNKKAVSQTGSIIVILESVCRL